MPPKPFTGREWASARSASLSGKKSKRAGIYHFGPGEEMQHDTSPHTMVLNGRKGTAQCASLVLCYSRRLFSGARTPPIPSSNDPWA